MVDILDDGKEIHEDEKLKPLNIKEKPKNATVVAIKDSPENEDLPIVTAAGRGKFAEQLLQIAHEHDIKVREDSALAEILATIELDSPIPSEAFLAVAEILSYVYQANGAPNPFDAVLKDAMDNGQGTAKGYCRG